MYSNKSLKKQTEYKDSWTSLVSVIDLIHILWNNSFKLEKTREIISSLYMLSSNPLISITPLIIFVEYFTIYTYFY